MEGTKRGRVAVLIGLFLLLSALTVAEEGCYTFTGGSETLYCVEGTSREDATADCAQRQGCDMSQHFVARSCAEFPACEQIKCSVDCAFHPKGKCEQLGTQRGESEELRGVEVTPENEHEWCAPRCCRAGAYCSRELVTKWQCLLGAQRVGVPAASISSNFEIDTAGCINQWCGAQLGEGSIHGRIVDADGMGLPGARVELEGVAAVSQADGVFEFSRVAVGSHTLRVSLERFATASRTIDVRQDEVTEITIILSAGGVGGLQGKIVEEADSTTAIPRATLRWTGPAEGLRIADVNGQYEIGGLQPGEYQFTVGKAGFVPFNSTITITEEVVIRDFALAKRAVQGIRGRTFLNDEETFGVSIFVDGVRRGFSRFPDGYVLNLDPGTYRLAASQGEFAVSPVHITVEEGASVSYDLFLTRLIPECGPGNFKPVVVFGGEPMGGKNVIKLSWEKPCPEVVRYELQRFQNDQLSGQPLSTSAAEFGVHDSDVQGGQTYSYEITAVYADGTSVAVRSAPIYVGDSACAGKYRNGEPIRFCLVDQQPTDIDEGRSVWTCTQNRLTPAEDCSQSGDTQFCAPLDDTATCKDAGACSGTAQRADPFGLYHERTRCYGSADPETSTTNFCTFDSSNTIMDACKSCPEVKSCFDYRSKDACGINNCLQQKCSWVNPASNLLFVDYSLLLPGLVQQETGRGYCVPEEIDRFDYLQDQFQQDLSVGAALRGGDNIVSGSRCSLCGPTASLFQNFFCTAEVCSGLGRCYSQPSLRSCNTCGTKPSSEANCYSYQTKQECVAEGEGFKIINDVFDRSADNCGWGRCAWKSDAVGGFNCVKDGDADGVDDCSLADGREQRACRQDMMPGTTTVRGHTLSLNATTLTFQSQDDRLVGALYYCFQDAGAPDSCSDVGFRRVEYPFASTFGSIDVNLLDQLGQEVNGRPYRLKYYSKDRYHNQEKGQETFIMVDNVKPEFELRTEQQTVEEQSTLRVFVEGESEPMACTFRLDQKLPRGSSQQQRLDREVQGKSAMFENLRGIQYNLTVQCVDDYGNSNSKGQWLVFDQEAGITILAPTVGSTLASTQVQFSVATEIPATCELRTIAEDEKVADFVPDELGKRHQTELLPGFVEKLYADTYKVVCTELLTTDEKEDYFSFLIDFTGPRTQAVLRERNRVAQPTLYGWEEFFVRGVEVSLRCDVDGFACASTFYCLGEGCEFSNDPKYQTFNGVFDVNETTKICYYSVDEGGNSLPPFCGTLRVEGFGFRQELPRGYRYQDKLWAVSNQPSFDWQFSLRVPSQECRFDFNPGFVYEEIPRFKVIQPNEHGKYVYVQFPNETGARRYDEEGGAKGVYVQCLDAGGNNGPEQELFLEYDPSRPEITEAKAEPNPLIQGTKVKLTVKTDDKTTCRFSDQGHDVYELMNYGFPDEDLLSEDTLRKEHTAEYTLNAGELVREEQLNVLCRNGAGDGSELRAITFNVDYTQAGAISSLFPAGEHFASREVSAQVQTTKNARCELRDNETFFPFDRAGTQVHRLQLQNLSEGAHRYPVRCMMGDQVAEGVITFTVDLTNPAMRDVQDGNYTCGSNVISVFADAGAERIQSYGYEVYDMGEERGIAPKSNVSRNISAQPGGRGILLLQNTSSAQLPIQISTTGLLMFHRYVTKVRAQDAAGNVGEFAASDGVVLVNATHERCVADSTAPRVSVLLNQSACVEVAARLNCEDESGCKAVKFKKQFTSDCALTSGWEQYSGRTIGFSASGWLCYYAEDYRSNNISGKHEVSFADKDGDGVQDSCDSCTGTKAGAIADSQGCASGEVPSSAQRVDTDGDGLPDFWEKLYAACGVHYLSKDADLDGVLDIDGDFDNDGYTNKEEYIATTDPCTKDAAGLVEEEVKKKKEEAPEKKVEFPTLPIPEETRLLPLILLVSGLVLVLGGIGYLLYYYSQKPGVGLPVGISRPSMPSPGSVFEPWKEKLVGLQRQRAEKVKQRGRQSVFGAFEGFTRKSESIPKVDKILSGSAPVMQKIQKVAEHYMENKETLKPGLRQEEKSIFAKLENIATQTKDKKIHEVIDNSEASDIFAKLKKISSKRKS